MLFNIYFSLSLSLSQYYLILLIKEALLLLLLLLHVCHIFQYGDILVADDADVIEILQFCTFSQSGIRNFVVHLGFFIS
jgi:hypothetical protein